MQLSQVKELEQKYILGTYARYDVLIERGSGAYLVDAANKRYLDLLAGIGVNALGYNHPRVKQVLRKQIKRPLHVSNLFYHEYQGRLAEKLCKLSGLDRAFFTNSGAESIEACLKFSRAYAGRVPHNGSGKRYRVLAMDNAFHGRTFGALSATASKKYREPFEPLVPGFDFVEANNIADLEKKFTNDVCAVLIETIQGEGGIFPLREDFYRAVRRLTTEHGALLVADEIQCGLGRTGFPFHSQALGWQPDLLSVGKALGSGVPIGAALVSEKVAQTISAGDHGSTYGGNLMATRAAAFVLEQLMEGGVIEHVKQVGAHFERQLRTLALKHPVIVEVRGAGVMRGLQLSVDAMPVVDQARQRGLLVNRTDEKVIRLLPPLTIEAADIDRAVNILDEVFAAIPSEVPA